MTDLLANPLVPVATADDAEATLTALLPRLPAGATVVVCHVIEKAGGAPDKASVEQREALASEIFELVEARCADAGVPVETRLEYGTNVAETVFAAAADADATAIAFTPRGGARWLKFLSGDTTLDIVTGTDRPVVALPDEPRVDDEREDGRDDDERNDDERDDEERNDDPERDDVEREDDDREDETTPGGAGE